jgi:hypothetical protein
MAATNSLSTLPDRFQYANIGPQSNIASCRCLLWSIFTRSPLKLAQTNNPKTTDTNIWTRPLSCFIESTNCWFLTKTHQKIGSLKFMNSSELNFYQNFLRYCNSTWHKSQTDEIWWSRKNLHTIELYWFYWLTVTGMSLIPMCFFFSFSGMPSINSKNCRVSNQNFFFDTLLPVVCEETC